MYIPSALQFGGVISVILDILILSYRLLMDVVSPSGQIGS